MRNGHNWSGVRAQFFKELALMRPIDEAGANWTADPNGIVYDVTDDDEADQILQPFKALLQKFPDYNGVLVIEFISEGSYDPGSMYGGPDRLGSPPERYDDRSLVAAWIEYGQGSRWKLDKNVAKALFDHFEPEIYEVQLPEGPTGPEDMPDFGLDEAMPDVVAGDDAAFNI